MTRNEECAAFLKKYPQATNEEIAKEMDTSENNAKRIVSNLKSSGAIEVNYEDGIRNVTVHENLLNNKRMVENTTRREQVERMIEIVFDSLEYETQTENIINAGYLFVKLIDRL
ncbi:hypothetical protein ACWOA0_05735 [Ignavigranum ruoffiae]|uniref:Winged helix-turn-helix DNA-binding n=1 Tax=Ignavigranum ruoffiae TaxID=89093 RepID=A0A1H9BX44_9LACT|nr:hypothetical protein [Ignavigranum ruoffiae]SEP92938.1 hypothetical protein SAMN04488558_103118 [Ignavigranum ruoffiae]